MPLDKDYNSAFFGPNCSTDNALDLNLVLSRIMHYVVLGSHSTVKGVCAYKVRITTSEQCLQLGQSWSTAKLHPQPADTLVVYLDSFKMAKNNHQKSKNNKQPSAKPTGKSPNKQPPAKPTSKPTKCEICGKLHNGKSYPFPLGYYNASKFTNHGSR